MNFVLDESNDLVIKNNNFVMVSGDDEIRQRLLTNLRTFQGEWFLDTTIGVPYFQEIFIKNPNPETVASFIKNEILNTEGVDDIASFSIDYDAASRKFGFIFSVKTNSGNIVPTILSIAPTAVLPNESSRTYLINFVSSSAMQMVIGNPGDTAICLDNPGQKWAWDNDSNNWRPVIEQDAFNYTRRFATQADMLAATGLIGEVAIILDNPGQRWAWNDEQNQWIPAL